LDIKKSKIGRKFIFCSTTDDIGLNSLAMIFSLCHNVLSVANSYPVMNGKVMADYNHFRYDEVRKIFLEKKLPIMERDLILSDKEILFYSSSLFIKSFGTIACEMLRNNMTIIHLIGNPVDISLRFYEKGIYPSFKEDRTFLNLKYPANRLKPDFLKYREYRHKFFRIFWYCLECYVRSKELISRYRDMKHYVFFTKWLEDKIEIKGLLGSLGCKINGNRMEAAFKVYNNYKFIENRSHEDIKKKTLSRESAIILASRFVDRFGGVFQLSKEECEELIKL